MHPRRIIKLKYVVTTWLMVVVVGAEHQSIAVDTDDINAFVEELYRTVRPAVAPTPLYEIWNGERVEIEYLDGRANLPDADSLEITALDVTIASLFFDDFHVLYEGETGAGKTYNSETVLETVFGRDGYYSLQLRDEFLGASPTDPFTAVEQENGMPTITIDDESVTQYGGLFIDELNRARNTNEVIGLVDGEIQAGGERAALGLPIPDTDRKKGLGIIAAMNPAEAEYTDVRQLDLAGENRWVKFDYPDNVDESGSGQLERAEADDLHTTFWDRFRDRTGYDGDWQTLYPAIADPENVERQLDHQTAEFVDTLVGFVGRDPVRTFDRNTALAQSAGYSTDFELEESNYMERVQEAQGDMRQGFSRRDLEQIQDTGQLIGFIRSVKDNGSNGFDPSLTDIVAATGIVAESKTVSGAAYGDLVGIVDDARTAYTDILDDFEAKNDANELADGRGIRDTVWQSAVLNGYRHSDVDQYRGTLQDKLTALNEYTDNPAEAAIRSRLVADLAVLDHFSEQYEDAIADALDSDTFEDALYDFGDVVTQADRSMDKHRAVYDRLAFCR